MLLSYDHLIEQVDIDHAQTPTAGEPRRHRRPSIRTVVLALAAVVVLGATSAGSAAWAASTFTDVPADHPFSSDVEWIADQKIVTGYPDGTFRPSDKVTRGSLSAVLHRYSDSADTIVETKYHSNPEWNFTQTIACPDGKRAIAGGGMSDGSLVHDTGNRPWTINGKDGWKVIFHSEQKTATYTTAWALCVPD